MAGTSANPADWSKVVLKDKRGDLQVPVPRTWEYLPGAFGLTHLFVTQKDVEKRTSISITVTGIDNMEFDAKKANKDYPEYREGRMRWAQKMKANIKKFEPYSSAKNKFDYLVHKGGVAYELTGNNYQEYSYFILCTGKKPNMIHMKALTRSDPKTVKAIIDTMSDEIQCL